MRQLTMDGLAALRSVQAPPCVSLYQPTHRHRPERAQDPIRFRNLCRQLENSLRRKYADSDVAALLEKFRDIEGDTDFWNHRTDGLVILASPETFRLFEVQRPVRELLIVANTFYLKPLVRIVQSADRYQLLCLTRHDAKLFEGNRYALDPVELVDVPATIEAALGEDLTAPRVDVRVAPGGTTVFYGSGHKADEAERDRERFFRAVDRAILEHHSRPSGLPLMLVALAEHHAPFRAYSHNPHLLADGIDMNPDAPDLDRLRELAWQKIEPFYLERLARMIEQYREAGSRGLASDDLAKVAEATVAGRVGALLVEADRQIPGRVDEAGRVEAGELDDPEIGDVLDDLADTVARMDGEVVVVPAERMPSSTGLAATYRF